MSKQLPIEVLTRVIRYSVYDSEYSYTMDRWFKALQLTHVSKTWRDVGTPFVYSIAVLESVWQDETISIDSDNEEPTSYSEPSNTSLLKSLLHKDSKTSNIGHILAGNHSNHVIHIHTTLDLNNASFGHFMAFMSTILANKRFKLKNIKSLCVNINEDDYDDDDLALGHQMLQASQLICSQLPGVVHLAVSPSYHGLGITFASHLTRGFLGQLNSVYMVSEARNLPLFENGLSCLQINMKFQQARNIPRCIASSLKKLALFEVPLDYDWGCFREPSTNSSSGHVQFSKLWRLVVSYQEPTEKKMVGFAPSMDGNSETRITMDLPALRHLEITNGYACNVLKHGSFPEKLQTLRVSAPPSIMKPLTSKNLRFVSLVDIVVLTNGSDIVESDIHAIRLLGSLYRNTAISHGSLGIDARVLAKQPDILKDWKNLDALQLHNARDKDAAEGILRNACLPELDSLGLAALLPQGAQNHKAA
ncbi:hypothetical protein GGI22_000208 [Coemansia erecta]|nr:hypothetical protein GGI22_000208 [Coemansia erecta]